MKEKKKTKRPLLRNAAHFSLLFLLHVLSIRFLGVPPRVVRDHDHHGPHQHERGHAALQVEAARVRLRLHHREAQQPRRHQPVQQRVLAEVADHLVQQHKEHELLIALDGAHEEEAEEHQHREAEHDRHLLDVHRCPDVVGELD